MSPTLIEIWLKKLETDGHSPHTLIGYARALTLFSEWHTRTYGDAAFDPAKVLPDDHALYGLGRVGQGGQDCGDGLKTGWLAAKYRANQCSANLEVTARRRTLCVADVLCV